MLTEVDVCLEIEKLKERRRQEININSLAIRRRLMLKVSDTVKKADKNQATIRIKVIRLKVTILRYLNRRIKARCLSRATTEIVQKDTRPRKEENKL